MRRLVRLGCLAAALLSLPAIASAQITLFSEIGFRGMNYTVNVPRQNMPLGWPVRSVRVAPGRSWELCAGLRYRPPCNRATRNIANIRWAVASARPVGSPVTLPGVPAGSLRGLAAEFYPAPAASGRRIRSCANGAAVCAADRASRFCRARGWTRSAYSRQQAVGRRFYLADVLCVLA